MYRSQAPVIEAPQKNLMVVVMMYESSSGLVGRRGDREPVHDEVSNGGGSGEREELVGPDR